MTLVGNIIECRTHEYPGGTTIRVSEKTSLITNIFTCKTGKVSNGEVEDPGAPELKTMLGTEAELEETGTKVITSGNK